MFGEQSTAKSIRDEICDFLLKKNEIYKQFWEEDLENHLVRIRREGHWGTNLELLAFQT